MATIAKGVKAPFKPAGIAAADVPDDAIPEPRPLRYAPPRHARRALNDVGDLRCPRLGGWEELTRGMSNQVNGSPR